MQSIEAYPDSVKCRSMNLAFGPCFEEKSQLRRESMLALFKYATQWDDSTRLPLKDMRIDTVVLITVMRILSMDFYGDIVAQLTSHTREARDLSWNHKIGKVKFATIQVGYPMHFDIVEHVGTGLRRPLPFGMKILKEDTYSQLCDDVPQKPKVCLVGNYSVATAKISMNSA